MDFTQPIAGVPPLVWLLIMLVFGPPAILSKAAADNFGSLGALARWVRSRRLRSLESDRDELVARFGIEDVAYAALETRLQRLSDQFKEQAQQLTDQGESHRKEIDELKVDMVNERRYFEGQIRELRQDNEQWEDYGDWVGSWASDQAAILRHNGLEPTPPPFMSFTEFKHWRDTDPDES